MNRQLMITADGSHSVVVPASGLSYHSRYGAISESMHVFIEAGLRPLTGIAEPLHIFEMGFGSGLNALLTCIEAENAQQSISYHAIESLPLEPALTTQLNFCDQLGRPELKTIFHQLHAAPWEKETAITPWFNLYKTNADLLGYETGNRFHLIYYDAFAPDEQPELWTEAVFEKLLGWLLPGGVLVTYSAKGQVRRSMQRAGFTVEKLGGAPPKREMIRARRNVEI